MTALNWDRTAFFLLCNHFSYQFCTYSEDLSEVQAPAAVRVQLRHDLGHLLGREHAYIGRQHAVQFLHVDQLQHREN